MTVTKSVQPLGSQSSTQHAPGGIPWLSESPRSKEADQAFTELTTHRVSGDPRAMEPRPVWPWLRSSCVVGGIETFRQTIYPRWSGMLPHTYQLPPETNAPQGRPIPGQGLGSQQRTTTRAASPPARASARATPLSKHSGCAPPPRLRRPFPRYPL